MATFVLVHGEFEGGWCWQRVARRLRAKGHEVHTPTLSGSGDRAHLLSREIGLQTHVEDVCARIEMEDLRDVIVVGHAYGGAVVTGVGDRLSARIARVVYLDAAAPGHGQASTGALAEGTEDKIAELAAGEEWLMPPLPLEVLGIAEPDDIAWVQPRLRSHPLRSLEEPLHLQHGDAPPSFPVTYVVHTDKAAMIEMFGADPLQPFVAKAKRLGWRLVEIDAGRDAMITHPDRVTQVLLEQLED